MVLAEVHFLWMPLGDFFVAFGTLALAGFTGWLARETHKDVQDTHRLASIAQESHNARCEPFLVLVGDVRAVGMSGGFVARLVMSVGQALTDAQTDQLLPDLEKGDPT